MSLRSQIRRLQKRLDAIERKQRAKKPKPPAVAKRQAPPKPPSVPPAPKLHPRGCT